MYGLELIVWDILGIITASFIVGLVAGYDLSRTGERIDVIGKIAVIITSITGVLVLVKYLVAGISVIEALIVLGIITIFNTYIVGAELSAKHYTVKNA